MPLPMPPTVRARGRTAALVVASLAVSLTACLGGCQGLGGGGGVMPASEVGLPPSLRGSVKGAPTMTGAVDEDGRPVSSNPNRQLALPKNARGETRSAEAGPRRIDRDDLEGATQGGTRSGPGIQPGVQNGRVGLGGQF